MTRKTADQLLPIFKHLEGTYSEHFSSKIDQVLVTYRSFAKMKWHREWLKNNPTCGTHLLQDEGEYTIVAILKNGRIQSVKTLIKYERIQELYCDITTVDYLIA